MLCLVVWTLNITERILTNEGVRLYGHNIGDFFFCLQNNINKPKKTGSWKSVRQLKCRWSLCEIVCGIVWSFLIASSSETIDVKKKKKSQPCTPWICLKQWLPMLSIVYREQFFIQLQNLSAGLYCICNILCTWKEPIAKSLENLIWPSKKNK